MVRQTRYTCFESNVCFSRNYSSSKRVSPSSLFTRLLSFGLVLLGKSIDGIKTWNKTDLSCIQYTRPPLLTRHSFNYFRIFDVLMLPQHFRHRDNAVPCQSCQNCSNVMSIWPYTPLDPKHVTAESRLFLKVT